MKKLLIAAGLSVALTTLPTLSAAQQSQNQGAYSGDSVEAEKLSSAKTARKNFLAGIRSAYKIDATPEDIFLGLSLIKMAGDSGYVPAYALLGNIYLKGELITKNLVKARFYYTLAANMGDYLSQMVLSSLLMVDDGENGKPEMSLSGLADAAELLKLASAGGKQSAAYRLGLVYQNGVGVKQDDFAAAVWLHIAALNGNPAAADKIANLKLEPKHLKTALEVATYCKSRSDYNFCLNVD